MFLEALMFLIGKITFFAGSVIGGNTFPKPLSKTEEADCLRRMKEGDKSARDKLIKHNMRLVAHIVKKYNGSAETDDLISVGSIGLIKAINSYEAGKGSALATYTARCIENEILMLLRANKKRRGDVYLSDSVGQDKDGNELTLMDVICEKEEDVFARVDKSIEREKFLKFLKIILTKREYAIICLRYGLKGDRNYAQREVAKFLKISRSYISRIEKQAILKIKEAVKKGEMYC